MKTFAKILTVTVAALGVAPMARPAVASYFGSVTLNPGETRQVSTSLPGLNTRVCNDFSSAGAATVTIADNTPHNLLPGRCAEDIGNRIVIQSHASGPVMIVYRSLQDNQGHRMLED